MTDRRLAAREALCDLLREARLDARVTQVDLSERLGRPQSFVSKYEAGQRRLDLVDVWSICQALGVSFTSVARRAERRFGAILPKLTDAAPARLRRRKGPSARRRGMRR